MAGKTNVFDAGVRYGTVYYGSLFTDEERQELESRTERSLITVARDKIIIAFDRSDVVYVFAVRRAEVS